MGSDSAFGEPSFVPPVADLAAAIKGAEEALAEWGIENERPNSDRRQMALYGCAKALRSLVPAAREAEADNDRLTRQHEGCDAKVRSLVSQGLAAVRRAEEAEAALAEEREARERAERELAAAVEFHLHALDATYRCLPLGKPDTEPDRWVAIAHRMTKLEAALLLIRDGEGDAQDIAWNALESALRAAPAQADIRTQPIEEIRAELAAEGVDTAPIVAGIRERLAAMRAAPAQPAQLEEAVLRDYEIGLPAVSDEEAEEILGRFIASHFRKTDREHARFRIPADPAHDDDLRMSRYIRETRALRSALAARPSPTQPLEEAVKEAIETGGTLSGADIARRTGEAQVRSAMRAGAEERKRG